MRLLTEELRHRLPPMYATEHTRDPIVQAKFFAPWAGWTWYAIEFDGRDVCFGLVDGLEVELGYFSLSELASLRGPGGLRIERDLDFEPTPLSAVKAAIAERRDARQARLPFEDEDPGAGPIDPPSPGRSR